MQNAAVKLLTAAFWLGFFFGNALPEKIKSRRSQAAFKMNKDHIESSTSQIEAANLPERLNQFDLATLENFCETIANAGETIELQLLQLLLPRYKKQLWAALSPQLRQALQTLAQGGAA